MVDRSRVNRNNVYPMQAQIPSIYRNTTLGNSLQEVLDEMIEANDLQDHHKEAVL